MAEPAPQPAAVGPGTIDLFRSVGFLSSQLGTANARQFRQILAPTGLEPRQFAVLRHVAAAEGQSQNALADSLLIPPSRMVALLDELEGRGLVERRPNPKDRRARALYLTRTGRKLLKEAVDVALAHEAKVSSVLGPGEREQLIGMLQRIAAFQDLIPGVHPELATGERPFEPEA